MTETDENYIAVFTNNGKPPEAEITEGGGLSSLRRRIRSAGGKLLADVRLFDVYRDKVRVGEGKKSMAFSLTYRAADHTLTSEEVEKAHNKLVTKVMKSTGGEVRS